MSMVTQTINQAKIGKLGLREAMIITLSQANTPLSIEDTYERMQAFDLEFHLRFQAVREMALKLHMGKFITWEKVKGLERHGMVLRKF